LKILFVCLGNICRSPLAAGIMNYMLERHGVDGLAESCGTADWNVGSQADRRSIKVALDKGIDIRSHRARQIRQDDFEKFDAIIVMDRSNENAVKKIAPRAVHDKIYRILDTADVPDPYHSDESAFRDVFDTLWTHCDKIAARIAREAQ